MDIYLIRHTEVAVGRQTAYGQADVEVTANYPEQFERLQQHLSDEQRAVQPAIIFTSPLKRCRQLADDLAKRLTTGSSIETAPGQTAIVSEQRPAVQVDDRLKELHFGEWEMVPWSAIDPDQLATWRANFVQLRMPNGENFQDLFTRVTAFWTEQIVPLNDARTHQPIFVVTHGGVIRALLCLFMELPLQNAYRINLDYGAVSKVTTTNSSYTIQFINR